MKPAALLAALCLAVLSVAQTAPARKAPAPPPPPAEAAQFDFWVGEWEVLGKQGRVVGRNRIEKCAGGWGLLENWEGAGGGSGKSLNTWNPARKCWQQFWVGAGGSVLELSGGLDAQGRMVLQGESPNPAGGALRNRITWTPNANGTVRQFWETSADGGATWQPSFEGLYRHAGK